MPAPTQKTDSEQQNESQKSPNAPKQKSSYKAKHRPVPTKDRIVPTKDRPVYRGKGNRSVINEHPQQTKFDKERGLRKSNKKPISKRPSKAIKRQSWFEEIDEKVEIYNEERLKSDRESHAPDSNGLSKQKKSLPLKLTQPLVAKDAPIAIGNDSLPIRRPDGGDDPKPQSLPGGDMDFERPPREIPQGEQTFDQNRNYAITAITRLNQYLHTLQEKILKTHSSDPNLGALKVIAGEIKETIDHIHQNIHDATTDVSLALSLYQEDPYTPEKQKVVTQAIDQHLAHLTAQVGTFRKNWDGTVAALVIETKALIESKGQLQSSSSSDSEKHQVDKHNPDQALKNVYAPYRGREFRGLSQKNPEKKPGGKDSLQATLLEKSMSVNTAAHQLYDLLMVNFSKDQIGFIQAIRLMSRPDIHKVETAFANVPANTSHKTLRDVLVSRYGLPNVGNDRKVGQRAKYLFEVLDNGGKATNTTRLAVSLGLMERGTWARFVSNEEEIVRLAELADPHELEKLWNIYGAAMQRCLNTYNYRRVSSFVDSNKHYAAIKATAKGIEKEKDPEKKAELENKLGAWQANILQEKDGASAFLAQKDRQLASIIKSFSVGASKYTGRVGYSLPKTEGKVKDLAKEIELWVKGIAKEEKTYFNKQPIIRRYISGQAVTFKPIGKYKEGEQEKEFAEINITPPSPTQYIKSIGEGEALIGKGFWGKLGGSIAALLQYPAALTANILTLGRYTLFLSSEQKQYYRASKIGWNSGDRTFLRYMVEAGTANENRQEDHPEVGKQQASTPSSSKNPDRKAYLPGLEEERIEGHQASELKQIVKTVRHIIQTRGAEFEPEMLAALVNIARQADITYQGNAWDNAWNPINAKKYKINRRQDLVKSLMKLPDRWKVQFLNAFLPKDQSIDTATDHQHANDRTDWALDWVRRVLIALRVKPKQIFEVIGHLKYGGDVSPTYLQLRRYAGKETFSSHKVIALAFQLNDKELKVAQADKEMHVGLERQFAKHLTHSFLSVKWKRKLGNKSIVERFNSLKAHLHIHPLLDWSNHGKNITKGSYKKLEKKTSHTLSKRIRRDMSDGATDLNQKENRLPDANYTRYHIEYVNSENADDEIGKAQIKRLDEQDEVDNLRGIRVLSYKEYKAQVKSHATRFAQIIKNTKDYNKALQAALDVWQRGDEFVMPKSYFNDGQLTKWTNPNFRRTEHSFPLYARSSKHRKNIFFFEVYNSLINTDYKAYKKFEKLTNFSHRKETSSRHVHTSISAYGHNFDLINEILKSNYRWFRPASDRDKSGASAAFENLNGRVLLEEWTDVAQHQDKIKQRAELKKQIQATKAQAEPDQAQVDQLNKDYSVLDAQIKNECVPMPRQDRLDQIKNAFTNDGSYIDVVRNLLLHLSNSAEFDKSFFDALKEKGYQSGDMVTLTEVYKYLAAQEKEKFLTGGSMTIQWKGLTVKSTERKEGAARLVSAMRELDNARDEGKVHATLGENKGFFYDTYFDDVDERQESYEKQAAKYRKNIGKTLWLLSTAALVPFGAGIGGLSALAAKIVVSSMFTGQGMAITLLNSALDPYKHSIGGTLGETTWAGFKGALLSAVFLGSFELKAFAEQMTWGKDGASIEDLKENGGNKNELFWKQAGEYAFRKFSREIGKEIIKGMDKAVREGPKAGLVNFKDAIYNRAIIFELFTKTMMKMVFSDTVSGAKSTLDEAFGGNADTEDPDLSQDEISARETQNFRAAEIRRDIRRVLYEKMGFKHATKVLEYAVSNQNPTFRPFFVKYDVKRHTPTAQESVDHLKYEEDVIDALFEIEGKLAKIELDAQRKNKNTNDLKMPDLGELRGKFQELKQHAPEKLKDFAQTLKTDLPIQLEAAHEIIQEIGQQAQIVDKKREDSANPAPKNEGLLSRSYNALAQLLEWLRKSPSQDQSEQTLKKSQPLTNNLKSEAGKVPSTPKLKEKESTKVLSWFANNATVDNDRPNEYLPNHFRVTNVSGNNNNCLIFSIAAGIGRNLTPEEALQIRREIGVHHNGFLENTTDTVNNICSALGQSIEIRWWLQTSANTVTPAGINVTYGTGPNGGQVVNVVEVGNNHFQLLSEI
jgi:hypothetical protein